jgi:hypothetical protein
MGVKCCPRRVAAFSTVFTEQQVPVTANLPHFLAEIELKRNKSSKKKHLIFSIAFVMPLKTEENVMLI